ncbi:MAG: hypothetical protein ACJATP_001728 [Candidatus Azotimanducaceae bacterium]
MTSIPCIDTYLVSVHDGGSDELLLCPVLKRRSAGTLAFCSDLKKKGSALFEAGFCVMSACNREGFAQ